MVCEVEETIGKRISAGKVTTGKRVSVGKVAIEECSRL
jgi:hypothetical protein